MQILRNVARSLTTRVIIIERARRSALARHTAPFHVILAQFMANRDYFLLFIATNDRCDLTLYVLYASQGNADGYHCSHVIFQFCCCCNCYTTNYLKTFIYSFFFIFQINVEFLTKNQKFVIPDNFIFPNSKVYEKKNDNFRWQLKQLSITT